MSKSVQNILQTLRDALDAVDEADLILQEINWPESSGEMVAKEVADFMEGHVYEGEFVEALLDPIRNRLERIIHEIESKSGGFKNPQPSQGGENEGEEDLCYEDCSCPAECNCAVCECEKGKICCCACKQ